MSVLQDLRFAVRMLLKDRWFTVMAVIVLGLGIGANSTVFTLVNAVLLRGLPFDKPDQIMEVWTRDSRGRDNGISVADFEDWRKATKTFAHLSFVWNGSFNLSDEGRLPEQYPGPYVSADFFKMLGVTPILGRDFGPDDDGPGGPPVVMLGNSIWKQRYGGDASVIGKTVRLNGLTATIIGVMPEGMKFPFEAEIWLPSSQIPPLLRQAPRSSRNYMGIGRTRDGVTLEQARAELKTIGAELARQYPDTNKDLAPYPTPFQQAVTGPQIKLIFWALQGAVAFVLLIACANVANLLLARAANRSNEISVRVALGASRWQIVRQLMIESVLLALVAGAFGLFLSVWGVRWFDAQTRNVGKPYWMVFEMDWRTFAFFLAVCVATGVIFGLAPALHVSRTNVSEMLKEGGRTGSSGIRARRWTSALIVAEVALTLVLLAGAGFMMRSFLNMYRLDLGIDTKGLVVSNFIMPVRKYPQMAERAAFLQRIEEQLSSASDLEAATTSTNGPLGGGASRQLEVDGQTAKSGDARPTVTMLSVGPRYFDTLRLKVRQGRAFNGADGPPGREAVIINERLASLHFKGENPLNRRIRLTEERPSGAPNAGWMTVIGVVPDVPQRRNREQQDQDAIAYVTHIGNPTDPRTAMIIARARGDIGRATQVLREQVRVVDPDMALINVRTLDEAIAQQRWPFRVFGTMFTVFALMALVLSAVGLYGTTAYSVSQHTRDIGIRMVLGAQQAQVVWLFLRRGFIQLAIGLTIGFAGAMGVGKLLQSLLIGTSPRDPVTLITIVIVLTVVGIAACIAPARRATRLDPAVALRHE